MVKTLTFGAEHMTVAYLLSGSLLVGGAIALVESAINSLAYFFDEKVWERLQRRRTALAAPAPV